MGNHSSSSASAGSHSKDEILAAIDARNGQTVALLSAASGGCLEAKADGNVDARGGNQRNANWTLNVVNKGGDEVSFVNVNTSALLRATHNTLTADGSDPKSGECKFKIVHYPTGNISLQHSKGWVGFTPDGSLIPTNKVNRETQEGQLQFEFGGAQGGQGFQQGGYNQQGFGAQGGQGGFGAQGGFGGQGGFDAGQGGYGGGQGGYGGGQGGYGGGQGGNGGGQGGGYGGGQGGYGGGQGGGYDPNQGQGFGGQQGYQQGGYGGGQGGQGGYAAEERREERKEERREERRERREDEY